MNPARKIIPFVFLSLACLAQPLMADRLKITATSSPVGKGTSAKSFVVWEDAGCVDADNNGVCGEKEQTLDIKAQVLALEGKGLPSYSVGAVKSRSKTGGSSFGDLRVSLSDAASLKLRWSAHAALAGTGNGATGAQLTGTVRKMVRQISGPEGKKIGVDANQLDTYSFEQSTPSDLDPAAKTKTGLEFTGTTARTAFEKEAWVELEWKEVSSWDVTYTQIGSGEAIFDQDGDDDTSFTLKKVLKAQDADNDGLSDKEEAALGTDPKDADTDNDGLSDSEEVGLDGVMNEGDTSPVDGDSDDDGLSDGNEVNGGGLLKRYGKTNPLLADSDGDKLDDGIEAGVSSAGVLGGTSDGTGVTFTGSPKGFVGDADPKTTTNPNLADTDNDGINDGDEDINKDGAAINTIGTTGTNGTGETDPTKQDTDEDGLTDGDEIRGAGALKGLGMTDPLDVDTDDGGVHDGAEVLTDRTDPTAGNAADDVGADADADGLTNAAEAILGTDPNDSDTDNDGLSDAAELGFDGVLSEGDTNPLDADSDDDGLSDGAEVTGVDGKAKTGDETNPLAADSDKDGLVDGLEAGITAPVAGGSSDSARITYQGTNTKSANFVIDADPETTTNPAQADSDSDGLSDGAEDADKNGSTANTIGDSSSEGSGETDPNNNDTDADGLIDGDEVNGTGALAKIGTTNPLDTDTDDGGTEDGTEVLADSTNPTKGNGADDAAADPDDDGLSNAQEAVLGTDPDDSDTDNDGLNDGSEVGKDGSVGEDDTNPLSADTDSDGISDSDELLGLDGKPNTGDETMPLVADTDADGLSDGLEVGVTESIPGGNSDFAGIPYLGTDEGSTSFIADADPASKTDPTNPDTDMDGLKDGAEDANQDGSSNNPVIGGTGTSGSGETDPLLEDTDSDGLLDGNEVNGNGVLKGIGITDPLDTDTDDGGVRDGDEVLIDGTVPTTGNGSDDILPSVDADSDGVEDADDSAPNDPCIPSNTVAACDTDGDTLPDGFEIEIGTDPTKVDTDNDGIPDAEEATHMDTDGDGVSDAADADSDNDGIPDIIEVGDSAANPTDTDTDNVPDYRDSDSDNDGIPDAMEDSQTPALSNADSDQDGLDDVLDVDQTNGSDVNSNGVDDALESSDTDGDGTPNHLDTDSDNDGIPDAMENQAGTGNDADADGIDDAFDADATGGSDTNKDGIDDVAQTTDTEGDGMPDHLDIDADNDGIPDSKEANVEMALDSDNDGIKDLFDVDASSGTDANNDGVDDNARAVDTDGDSRPDYIDLDSDNDGLYDVVEAGGDDLDDEAQIDNPATKQGSLTSVIDDDVDGVENYRDLESNNPGNDGTGVFDNESDPRVSALDENGDGIVDGALDTDGDGILDIADPSPKSFGAFADSDSDGIPDSTEGTSDADNDGIADFEDVDSDNDGIPDAVEAGANPLLPADTDGDGTPDYLDLDSDNDGFSDAIEQQDGGDDNQDGIADALQPDVESELRTSIDGGAGSMNLLILGCLLLLLAPRLSTSRLKRLLALACTAATLSIFSGQSMAGEDCASRNAAKYDGSSETFKKCWYVGAGFGLSHVDPEGESGGWSTDDDSSDGYQLLLGWQFAPHWFGELKYADLGEAGLGNRVAARDRAYPSAAITYKVPSLMAGYLLRDVDERLNAYGKIGIANISNKAEKEAGTADYREVESVQLAIGLGAQYRINSSPWLGRLELDYYDKDAWFASLSVIRYFGNY